jgi:hypothetical protein
MLEGKKSPEIQIMGNIYVDCAVVLNGLKLLSEYVARDTYTNWMKKKETHGSYLLNASDYLNFSIVEIKKQSGPDNVCLVKKYM